jgi:hypothetical protein
MKKAIIFLAVTTLLIFSNSGVSTTKAWVEIGGECTNPTTTLSITAAPSGRSSDISFNKDELHVDTNTCFTMKLINKAPNKAHRFVIYSTDHFEGVDIRLKNNTAGPNGDGVEQTNVMSPSHATTLTYFCSSVGHMAAGMKGELIVGNPDGGFLPGFQFSTIFVSLITGIFTLPYLRKRKT